MIKYVYANILFIFIFCIFKFFHNMFPLFLLIVSIIIIFSCFQVELNVPAQVKSAALCIPVLRVCSCSLHQALKILLLQPIYLPFGLFLLSLLKIWDWPAFNISVLCFYITLYTLTHINIDSQLQAHFSSECFQF